jgi:Holliday junction resolvase RusA-like endonuclease
MNITITTELPAAPLSPNSRSHWRVKHAASKRLKGATAAATETALALDSNSSLQPPYHEVSLLATYYHTCRRRRDPDNHIAKLKYAIDGLVAGGLLIDDDKITLKPVQFAIDKAHPRLELHITLG